MGKGQPTAREVRTFPWLPFLLYPPVLALLAVVCLSGAVGPFGPFYSPQGLALALAALGLAVLACVVPQGKKSPVGQTLLSCQTTKRDPSLALLVAAAGVLLGGCAQAAAGLLYTQRPEALAIVQIAVACTWIVQATFLLDVWRGPVAGPLWARLVLLFVFGALLRAAAVAASPTPNIDVYSVLEEGPQYLLEGTNPYSSAYTNPYEEGRPRHHGLAIYPPLPILLALPFRAAGLDVRYANVICDLIAALVLLMATGWRGNWVLGAAAAGLYLNLPRVPFVIEQAWYEPMLAALLGGGLLLLDRGRRAGFLLLGLGLTGKQYGIALLPALATGQRRHWRGLLVGLAATAMVMLPFILWDPWAFWDVTFLRHLQLSPRLDSITLYSGAFHLFGLDLPRPALLASAALLIGLVSAFTPRAGTATGLWLGTALLIFVLFHKQGFINYFYLVQYLLLLGLVGGATRPLPTAAEPAAAVDLREPWTPAVK